MKLTFLSAVLISLSHTVSSLPVPYTWCPPNALCPAHDGPSAIANIQRRTDHPLRTVAVIVDTWRKQMGVSPTTGKQIFQIHSALQFSGNDKDGPMRVELCVAQIRSLNRGYLIVRALDFTTVNSGQPIPDRNNEQILRHVQDIGQTRLTNAEIAHQRYGTGLAADTWSQDPVYRTKTSNVNSCNTYIRRLIAALGLTIHGEMVDLFEQDQEFARVFANYNNQRISLLAHETVPMPGSFFENTNWRIIFNIRDPKDPVKQSNSELWRKYSASYPRNDGTESESDPDSSSSSPKAAESGRSSFG